MNPPGWPVPKTPTCPCDDCHLALYPDLAYAVTKGGPDIDGPVTLTDEPTGDAMRWTGDVDEFPFRVECPVEGCDLGVHAFVKCDLDAGRITHLDHKERPE